MPDEKRSAAASFGANEWLVEEMYQRYRENPTAVSESWQEFFADYRPDDTPTGNGSATATTTAPAPQPAAVPAPVPEPSPTSPPPTAQPLRGAAASIVANMEASLGVPTATSFRDVPAKLLEINRKIINGYLGRTRG